MTERGTEEIGSRQAPHGDFAGLWLSDISVCFNRTVFFFNVFFFCNRWILTTKTICYQHESYLYRIFVERNAENIPEWMTTNSGILAVV